MDYIPLSLVENIEFSMAKIKLEYTPLTHVNSDIPNNCTNDHNVTQPIRYNANATTGNSSSTFGLSLFT